MLDAYGRGQTASALSTALCRQFLQQRLRLLQIARVKSLRKPPVHRSEEIARLLRLLLVAPEARSAPGFSPAASAPIPARSLASFAAARTTPLSEFDVSR